MTNKASDSTSGAGMETIAVVGPVFQLLWVGAEPLADICARHPALRIRSELVLRTDASRLLAEREERIAKLKAALTALRRSHDADVDGHGLTVGQLLVINEALKD